MEGVGRKITEDYRGREGVQKVLKNDYVIFECSLMLPHGEDNTVSGLENKLRYVHIRINCGTRTAHE